jgi:hypothetical protein
MNKKNSSAGTTDEQRTAADSIPSASLAQNGVLAVCPVRVQRKRTKGYKMPPNTKSVTRPGKFGNPYKIGMHNVWDIKDLKTGKSLKDYLIEKNGENKYHDVEDVLLAYRQNIAASQAMQRLIKHYLKGKNLACFCPLDKPCHADILLEVANG